MLETFSALAEPNRMRIVELLREGPLTVGEIAERLNLRQPQTSKHLKVLTESGLVNVKADANRRIYSLSGQPFETMSSWLLTFRPSAEERLDNLSDYLEKLQRSRDQAENGKRLDEQEE